MIVDLRSDTVTKPSAAMREAMANAEVGDDVWGDDPTVNKLEEYAANLLGKEAAVFCSSGTQTNQVAIASWTNPGDEVICHEESHIYRYEGGGIALNAMCSTRFLRGNSGRINPEEIVPNINPDDQHHPITSLVSIEDTANRGGGVYYDYADIERAAQICREHNLPFHLDGARVFNALVENGVDFKEYASNFDSISICLSKGLGAPIGSILLGPKDLIQKARRQRKRMGGAMRQVGIIAAGGLFALQNNIDRLKEDHIRAKNVASILAQKSWVKDVIPAQTNIVVAHLQEGLNEYQVCDKIAQNGILAVPFGNGRIRMTTHLDINDNHINFLSENLLDEV